MGERTSPCSGVSHCATGACALKQTAALVRTLHFPRGTGGGVQVQAPWKDLGISPSTPRPLLTLPRSSSSPSPKVPGADLQGRACLSDPQAHPCGHFSV